MSTTTDALESHLADNRERLLAFIRSKVSDPTMAEDILQGSLLKAIEAAPDLKDEDKFVSWFYQIVRNAITDHYRRAATASKYQEKYVLEAETEVTPEDEAVICSCFRELLPTLKDEYRELVEAMELGNENTKEMAEHLGITRNNLKVRRYRARQQLKDRLEETCRTCAEHGCLDCTCQ